MPKEPCHLGFLDNKLLQGQTASVVFGLEIPVEINDNYSCVLKDYWGDVICNTIKWFGAAQIEASKTGASFVSLYFNAPEPSDSEKPAVFLKYSKILEEIQNNLKIPLMLKFSSNAKWDAELAGALISHLKCPVIISPIQAANYKEIINVAQKTNLEHKFVLRTPIDINLTKELNILSIDAGLKAEQILIDPDMGCIGYGIDYGYSIIERICLARGQGDKMLDMPIIVFAGEESFKAKESKSEDFALSWGELDERAVMWEISTSSALIAAGANIVVVWHPKTLQVLNNQFCEVLCR